MTVALGAVYNNYPLLTGSSYLKPSQLPVEYTAPATGIVVM